MLVKRTMLIERVPENRDYNDGEDLEEHMMIMTTAILIVM